MLLSVFVNLLLWITITSSLNVNANSWSSDDIDVILDVHNSLRIAVATGNQAGYDPNSVGYTFPSATDMVRMEWDTALEKVATEYAKTCPDRYLDPKPYTSYPHSDKPSRKSKLYDAVNNDTTYSGTIVYPSSQPGIGENLGFKSEATPTIVIIKASLTSMLGGEATNYQYGDTFGAPFSVTGSNDVCKTDTMCGHFTQGIWGNTRYVGCGFSQCSSNTFKTVLVCNYFNAGNIVLGSIYNTGATCSACPSGSYCDCDGLCTYSATPPSCQPTSNPTKPTTAPTPAPTSNPTPAPTSNPAAAPPSTPECLSISNYINSIFNGNWQKVGNDAANKPIYTKTDEELYWYSYPPFGVDGYTLFSGGYIYGFCGEQVITDCVAGKWVFWNGAVWEIDTDAVAIAAASSACSGSAAQNNAKLPEVVALKSVDKTSETNNVDTYIFNMTEMHIILCLLIIVLFTMCAMIMGFCWYIKKKNKKENDNVNDDDGKMEMVYFESKDIENEQSNTSKRGTPTVDNKNENQPTLKISVNDKKLLRKLPQTTPVTPLIEDEQFDGM